MLRGHRLAPWSYLLCFCFLIFIYLFLAALGLSCGTRDLSLQRVGYSLWRTGFSLVVACRLISCSTWAL